MNTILMDILILVLVLGIICGFNSCTADTWNNGICPDCEIRYELRAALNSTNYYECPKCGQTVKRIVTVFDRW